MPDLSLPVLLVDDYASMRRTIRSMLQQIGFTHITEDDGSRAVEMIHDEEYGLIVSDLLMQPVSGLDLLREVRRAPRTADTLFVMVTGAAHQDVVLAARGLKVDGYIVKPFDTKTLQRKLFQLLDRAAPRLEPDVADMVPVATAAATAGGLAAVAGLAGEGDNAELRALKSAIDALYALLDGRVRAGDVAPHDDLVSLIRVYIDRAVGCGVEPHYREQLEAMLLRLDGLRGPGPGVVLASSLYRVERPFRGAAVVPDRRQSSAAAGEERRSGREARRYKRFSAPALHVEIADRLYRSIDWSIGGFCIGGYAGALQADKQIKVTLRVEGDEEEGKSFSDRATVVRNNAAAGTLALKFASYSSATLKILEYLTRRQQKPIEATRAPAIGRET